MGRRAFKLAAGIFLLLSSLTVSGWAQVSSSTGSIQGAVTDQSGALVPNATVTLSNTVIGITRKTTTQSDGTFIFALVPPSEGYRVEVEATGFQRKVISNLTVRVTEVANANLQLAVGAANEQVVVSGEDIQPVQTTNATLGGTLNQRVVVSLPLATRNIIDLLGTDAGVAAALGSPSPTGQGSNSLFVAGGRATANNYVVNGVDANNFEFHTLAPGIVPTPSPDAVQEFKTQTSLFDATMGRGSGGNINLITRSGTKQIHGSAYEFHRDRSLSANDYFFNKNNTPKPALVQNIFGGSIGGPLPKDILWFGNYEGTRQKNGVSGSIIGFFPVLPAQRDAASLAAAFGVPVDRIDPVAVKILNAAGPYDGKLVPSGTGAAVGRLGSFAFSSPAVFNGDQFTTRLDKDWTLGGGANRISGAYFWSRGQLVNPGGAVGATLGQPYSFDFGNDTFSLNDTHTFSSNLLNEFTFGFAWHKRDISALGGVTLDEVGMQRFNKDFFNQLPTISFSDGALSCCGYGTSADQTQHNASFNIRDMVTYITGPHSLRFGYEHRRYQFNFNSPISRGSLSFANTFANQLGPRPPTVDNLAFRDFLIGAPSFISIGSGANNVGYRARDNILFIQDDWRATRRLTFNLGLRYELLGNNTEVRNRIGNFDPSLVSEEAKRFGGPGLLAGFVSPEELEGFGTPGVSRSTMKSEDRNNFAPRVSFALDAFGNGKLALRGGYAIFYQRIAAGSTLQTISSIPFALNAGISNTTQTGILNNPFPVLPLPTQFPLLPTPPTLTGINPTTGVPTFTGLRLSVSAIDRNMRTPYTQQWNLTTQYEFLPRWTAELGYLGSHGVKLLSAYSINNALLRNESNPGPFGVVTNSSTNREARVPIVGFSENGIFFITNDGNSVYHALLATVNHQFSKGLFFKAAYTFSKSIDNYPANAGFDIGGTPGGNQFSPELNRGLSAFDVRHRFVVTYVYDLPGPKKGIAGAFLGGWSISGLTTYQSGLPGSVFQSIGTSSLSGTSGYGNITPGCQLVNNSGRLQDRLDNYLNVSCVSTTPLLAGGTVITGLTPQETQGNQNYVIDPRGSGRLQGSSARGSFRAPFQQRWDFSLAKRVPLRALGESGNIEFRAEFFKLFNTPIFNGPSSTAGTTTFGRITSTIDNTGRQVQFALKVNF
jgi:hypothetical protein